MWNSFIECLGCLKSGCIMKSQKSQYSIRERKVKSNSQKTPIRSKKSAKVGSCMIPQAKRTVSGDCLFDMDDYLRNRWFIKGLIGQGGYGQIYLALDIKKTLDVAIKAESRIRRGRTSKRMILEQRILLLMQGEPHVPCVYASGHDDRINFIVMELLSVNVGELKKRAPYRRLSRPAVGRILMQGIAALRDIHFTGYLHRDVKPANMCFSLAPAKHHVLVFVDFGLVRRFRNSNGTLRVPRKKAGFRGTVRYVSCRVHDRMEQTPVDDLISLVYSGIELLLGELPWKTVIKHEDVKSAKEELLEQIGQEQSYLALTPKAFQFFCHEILSMEQWQLLDYSALQLFLTDVIGDRALSDPYDWENGYKDTDVSTPSTEGNPEEKK